MLLLLFYGTQENKIIKVQALWRGHRVRKMFLSLFHQPQPAFRVVRSFAYHLDFMADDYKRDLQLQVYQINVYRDLVFLYLEFVLVIEKGWKAYISGIYCVCLGTHLIKSGLKWTLGCNHECKECINVFKSTSFLNFTLISESQGSGSADYPTQPAVSPAAGCYGCQDWFVGSQQNCIASTHNKFCVLNKGINI